MNHLFNSIARWMALLGGLVLVGLIALTNLSILGRSTNSIGHNDWIEATLPGLSAQLIRLGPINGDFELVEAGVAFAILCFFPWCMIKRGHATVDVFTTFLPVKVNHCLDLLWDLVFAAVMVVITWRLYEGTLNKLRYTETTLMLEFPVWWAFALCTLASGVASVVCAYMVTVRVGEILSVGDERSIEGSQP